MNDLCTEVAEQLALALAGSLPARLETHLDSCPRCLALLEDAVVLGDDIQHVFAKAGDDYHHAPDFEAKVLEALDPDGVEPTRPMRRLRLQI